MKSLFRWIGQSSQTWEQIIQLLPPGPQDSYVEPFIGAGWVFLNLLMQDYAKEYYINDANPDVVNFWQCVKYIPGELLSQSIALEIRETAESGDLFEQVAHEYNTLGRHIEAMPNPYRAALFAYIGQFSFRGLTAWNQDGTLRSQAGTSQVGRYAHPSTRLEHIKEISKKMERARITIGDFQRVPVPPGSVVFMDPPYHGTLQTHNHPDHKFTLADQANVVERAMQARLEGSKVLCLNAATPEIVSLYSAVPDAFDVHYISKNTHLKTRKNITHKVGYDFVALTYGHSGSAIKTGVNIQYVPIGDLKTNKYNPNQLTSQQLSTLSASIKKHGMTMPIAISPDSTIIDGEHRWRICQSLGHTAIPVVVLELDEANTKLATLQYNLGRGSHEEAAEKAVLESIFELGGMDDLLESHLFSDEAANSFYDDWMKDMAAESANQGAPREEIVEKPPAINNKAPLGRTQLTEADLPAEVPLTFMVPRELADEVERAVATILQNTRHDRHSRLAV